MTRQNRPPRVPVSKATRDLPPVDDVLEEVHRLRLAAIKAGEWPTWCETGWRERAADARARRAHGYPTNRADDRAIETADALDARDRKQTRRRRLAA